MKILALILVISIIEIIIALCVNWRNEDIGIATLSSGITLFIVTIIFLFLL